MGNGQWWDEVGWLEQIFYNGFLPTTVGSHLMCGLHKKESISLFLPLVDINVGP